jgi:hypothetical protein
LKAQGYGSESLPKNKKDAEKGLDYKLYQAAREAMESLANDIKSKIRKLQPPSPEEYRWNVWDDFVRHATS